MQFDLFTLIMASSLIVFMSGTILAYFWSRTMRHPWLAMWAVSFMLMAVSMLVTFNNPGDPGVLRSAVGNAVLILAFGFVWSAVRLFEGRRPIAWLVLAPALIWVGIVSFPGMYDSLAVRVVLISVATALFCGLSTWELWRGRTEQLSSKKPLIVLVGFLTAFYLGRIPLVDLAPYPYGARAIDSLISAAMAGTLVTIELAATILMVAMTLERRELAQRELATTDPLTGFLNRRGLEAALPDQKLPAGHALIVFDLDHFKQVNDSFGHAAGDALIATFALICREELRHVDHAVRLGGEEFALVLAQSGPRSALAVAERIRDRYATHVIEVDSGAIAGTASGGVYVPPPQSSVWLSGALAAADRAMYQAKQAGRNRVFVYDDVAPPSQGFDERCVAPKAPAASV